MNQAIKQHLSKNDNQLAEIINFIELEPILSSENVFEDLVSCIIEQQIPYRSRGVMMKKLMDLLENAPLTPEFIATLDEEAWAKKKLSNKKYHTLLAFANHWETHKMDNIPWKSLTDEEVTTTLTDLKGIGQQTAQMILLYTLERPNVFPVNDYHLKIIMAKVYDLNPKQNNKKAMLEIAESWKPYQSYATRYLLAYKDFLKKR